MLKERIYTGMVLLVFAALFIIFASVKVFIFGVGILTLISAWEWSSLMQIKSLSAKAIYFILNAVFMVMVFHLPVPYILFPSVFCWLIFLFFVVRYPKNKSLWNFGETIRGIFGIVVLVPAWYAISFIRAADDGKYAIVFLLTIVFSTDIGAYFFGKLWGNKKLHPNVSPQKTWVGFWGGLLLATVIAGSWIFMNRLPLTQTIFLIVIAAFTSLASVLGDLFESMLKREAEIKDTGAYLPGHGGLLDRMDSMSAAAPIFLLGLFLLNLKI